MGDLKDDEQLELGFARGKRVEFTYDEPEEVTEPETEEERSAGTQMHRRKGIKATVIILIAAAFCAILAGVWLWFHERGETRNGLVETQETGAPQDTDSAQQALTLAADYSAHLESLKSYLSSKYPFADTMELEGNGEYRLENELILIADLDGDGVRPEAIILTEYVVNREELLSSQSDADEACSMIILSFDLADQIQECSIGIGLHRTEPTQCLMLSMKEDNTTQIILYKQELSAGAGYSLLFEYNPCGIEGVIRGTDILQQIGEVPGKITSHRIVRENGEELVCYDLNGVYQVREAVSGNNGYVDYAYERVYSYMADRSSGTLQPVQMNGRRTDYPEAAALPVYYELENAPWWNMRRPLLAAVPAAYMDEAAVGSLPREVLYGTAAHLLGGYEGTDMYLVETDYGDRGIILLSAPDDPDVCMVGLQGLPFLEVFAPEEQEALSEDLYAYLDLHITDPGYYKIDELHYIWIDLNGDGVERRFLVDELVTSCFGENVVLDMIPFYVEHHADDTVMYLTVTDLDPTDHRMEIGFSAFFTVPGENEVQNRAFTRLYQSLDGVRLLRVPEPVVSRRSRYLFYFTPFDPVSGEANYGDGRVQLEYAPAPGYVIQAVYDGEELQIPDDTIAAFRENVQTTVMHGELPVHRDDAPDTEEDVCLPEGTEVTLDGFMLKTSKEDWNSEMLLYRAHVIIGQDAYYTDYMTLEALQAFFGDIVTVPYEE